MPSALFCIHEACATNTLPQDKRGHLFSLPRNEDLRLKWLINLNRLDLSNLTYIQLLHRGCRVCKHHFDERQFQTNLKLKLNRGVIPKNVAVQEMIVETREASRDIPSLVLQSEFNGENSGLSSAPNNPKLIDLQVVTPHPFAESIRGTVKRKRVILSLSSTFAPPRINLSDLGVKRLKDLSPKKKQLYARLQRAEQLLFLHRKRRLFLRQTVRNVKVDILSSSTYQNIINIHSLPRTLRLFVFSLLNFFVKNKKIRRYSLEDKSIFLLIFKHGPCCYSFLQKILCLPSVQTLERTVPSFELNPGLNKQYFSYLNSASENISTECTLLFNEMKLSTKNVRKVGGFEDTRKLPGHVLVFMLRGIAERWKQPVAYYFTQNAANQYTLKSLIMQVVRAVHKLTKFRIVASVCNVGSRNVAALRVLSTESGRDSNDFIYAVDGQKIIHLFDVPCLLKCLRNNFLTANILFEGKLAKWGEIKRLLDLEGADGAFKTTKLTNAHVSPTHRQKLKVKLATQVFSQSTAAILKFLTNAKVLDADGTAHFIKFVNDLFDSLNSDFVSSKPLACRLKKNSSHFEFWRRAQRSLRRIKLISPETNTVLKSPPSITYLICTIRNVQYLFNFLTKNNFQYLLLKSLNQDPVENLFSIIRGLCRGNTRPSTSQFAEAYQILALNNSIKCDIASNCEDDGESLLLSYETLLATSDTDSGLS